MVTFLLSLYQSKLRFLKFLAFLLEFTFEFVFRLRKSSILFTLILCFNFILNLDFLKLLHHLNLLFLISSKILSQLTLRL